MFFLDVNAQTYLRNGGWLSSNIDNVWKPGNKNKGKGNGAGLARESQSDYFADEFVITHAHCLGTDTQHD